MATIENLKDKLGLGIYPKTLTKAVYEEGTNKRLDNTLIEISEHNQSHVKLKGNLETSQLGHVLTSNGDGTSTFKEIVGGGSDYVHPSTHPASIIIEEANKRFMTDAERTKLGGLSNYVHPTTPGNKHIPSGGTMGQIMFNAGENNSPEWMDLPNAVMTVNGMTGPDIEIDGGDIRIGAGNLPSPMRINELINMMFNGLEKAMSKSGGVLENYTEKLNISTGTIDLNLGNVFHITPTANTTISIANPKVGSHSFTLYVEMGATVRSLTFPASVKWQGGTIPEMTQANKMYILVFSTINKGVTWYGGGGGY